MTKHVLGEARTVRELLHSAKFSVDYYQRDYQWRQKQVLELLEDLSSKFQEEYDPADPRAAVESYRHYFLGSIVVSNKDGRRYLVDGQQRLTSLTLLLIFLHNLQRGRADAEDVSLLIFSTRYNVKSFNLDVPERTPCMEALFEDKPFQDPDAPEAVVNLRDRYADIEAHFPDELAGPALPYFVDWLRDNVRLVEITAFSDEDAYTIFETMNDRGLSLTPTEMLKGYLLNHVTEKNKRDACNDTWKDRVQELAALGKDTDADAFKSWLRSQHAVTIREGKANAEPGDFDRIGSEFHRWVRDSEKSLGLETSASFAAFIQRDFDFYARQYVVLTHASRELQEGLEPIYYNAQAGFTLQPMLLLAPLRPGDNEVTVRRKWRLTATYLDILLARRVWNYRMVSQSTMKSSVFAVAKAIRGLDPEALAAELTKALAGPAAEGTFNDGFALHGTNRRSIHRVLARLTDFVGRGSGMASHYAEYTLAKGVKYEVEHIWANHPERHADEFPQQSEFRAFRNRLGGLLLLPKGFNGSFNDDSYAAKLDHYYGQNLLAQSLHPHCYEKNPGFLAFVARTGLPFKAHPEFRRQDLQERTVLYGKIAEQVWSPDRITEALAA